MSDLPPILTKRETAEFLRCTERHVDVLRSRGELPFQRFGGGVRFNRGDVEALLKSSGKRHGTFGAATRISPDAAELPPFARRPVRA